MSKGKFAPGKRVLLLAGKNCQPHAKPFVGTTQRLLKRCSVYPNSWDMDPPIKTVDGFEISWSEPHLMLFDDPDLESPEESTEAMRLLTHIPVEVTA